MATTTYRATNGSEDGYTEFTGATYTPDSGATAYNGGVLLGVSWDLDGATYRVQQSFFVFDLTSPTTGDAPAVGSTINSATLNLYLVEHGSEARTIDVYAYDWGATLALADHRTIAQLQTLYDSGNGLVASYNIPGGWGGAEGNHDFTSGTAAESAVETAIGSTLRLIMVGASYRAGTTPTNRGYASFAAADDTTESHRPLLTIDHSPPPGFTGLTVTRKLHG